MANKAADEQEETPKSSVIDDLHARIDEVEERLEAVEALEARLAKLESKAHIKEVARLAEEKVTAHLHDLLSTSGKPAYGDKA